MAVEHGAGDTAGEAVMPEATISHDADRLVGQGVAHARGTGEGQPVAHDGIAQIKGSSGGEGMTTDIR